MIYCTSHKKKGETAGAKAPADISSIAKCCGMKELPFEIAKQYRSINVTRLMAAGVGKRNWKRLMKTVQKDDWIIVQHPNENILMANHYIDICKKKIGCHFVALIHDLDSIRRSFLEKGDTLNSRNELADNELLRKYDYLICHNDSMKSYLISNGYDSKKIINLEIFDYLHDCNLPDNRKKEKRVVIAGNLLKAKCGYLYKLINMDNLSFKLDLFGPGFACERIPDFVEYHGVCDADKLPGKLEGSFGLVWDGTELDGCSGNAGEYIRFNNPHKCSLFLASNMPVIIWEKAALAPFVKEHGVGLTVNSLMDIGTAIDELSDEDYRKMVDNTKKIGSNLRNGYYFANAVNHLKNMLGERSI